ncbi:formate dehydrogenase accessory sulfurtransferase FdhD [Tropicimonas sp. S265A]|uniref:formate dehydrogenase accessory sulfurtransferase FdhD n=1 Tax=Tropicimonas sp. S265A TaxID=3415134 RepID=UPI003C7E9874
MTPRALPPARARALAEEVPVALSFDGTTQAVMMASPADLEDFGIGFANAEGIARDSIRDLEVVAHPKGLEVQMWLAPGAGADLAERRRKMAGPVGCGLCGIDSLEEALRAPAPVQSPARIDPAHIPRAVAALRDGQKLHDETRAAHGAGLWHPARGLIALREDVGRHNALDKLIGAALRAGLPHADCAIVMTSRVSVELVQKTAQAGVPILIAVSAPTALAVRTAAEAGVTLITNARGGDFELRSHGHRIQPGAKAEDTTHVA